MGLESSAAWAGIEEGLPDLRRFLTSRMPESSLLRGRV